MGNDKAASGSKSARGPGFIPGDPHLPMIVRVYGAILAAAGLLGMLMVAALILVGLGAHFVFHGEWPTLVALGIFACWFGIALFLYRLGKGLCKGERQAVYAICALAVICLCWSVFTMLSPEPQALPFLLTGLWAVPIPAALGDWGSFK